MTTTNGERDSRDETAQRARGFSLVELLIVVSIMGIFAGLVLTSFEPGVQGQLEGAAQIVAADLAFARNLAVTNDSTYKVSFDIDSEQYLLEHSGTNSSLDTLPETPFRDPLDPPDQHITHLLDLPLGGARIELVAVQDLTPSPVAVKELEFGPLGETTRSFEILIWLASGQENARRYIPVRVHPVTGLATVGELRSDAPADIAVADLAPL